ncbi:MAG: phenylalanine--tRNA ligase subunit beta [Alphaproteobacteria bacterium]|nr:MAG: phenylalanine--tRNA ligase subunit beta [Alphaproteobacteria bacterium]
MKFTLTWLKKHLETNHTLEEILEALTSIGLEVESCINPSEALDKFVVAEIIEAYPHPDADRLQVCTVNDGSKTQQIVCGARNACSGLKVALALPNAIVPANQMKIQAGKIRGVESHGMLCSADELGLSRDRAEGILELENTSIPGTPLAQHLNLDDPIIDVAITPNRADCFSVRGIARDLAVKGLGTLKPLEMPEVKGSFQSQIKVSIHHSICPHYLGREISGIKNKESPPEIQRLLRAIDIEPISAVVDFTNFITHDIGRPAHAYDAETISGPISIRHAEKSERFTALNHTQYTLSEEDFVLADDQKSIALPGIIGGENTGCSNTTQRIFLEVAYFDPTEVAKMGQRHHIHTDCRTRMERGLDTHGCAFGMTYLTHLIRQHCGGEVSEIIAVGTPPKDADQISLAPSSISKRLGISIDLKTSTAILKKLGMEVKTDGKGEKLIVQPPSWRPDIRIEEDLIEEIARIYGYEKIEKAPLPSVSQAPSLNIQQQKYFQLTHFLPTRGFDETVSWSMIPGPVAKLFDQNNPQLKIKNPISADLEWMRPSLLCQMLNALEKNLNKGHQRMNVFESGHVYHGLKPEDQPLHIAGIRFGSASPMDWRQASVKADVYSVKEDAFSCLNVLGLTTTKIQLSTNDLPCWYHPGRSALLMLGPKICLGHFGEIHPQTLKHFNLSQPAYAFELNLDALPTFKEKTVNKGPANISKFQSFSRDFSFLVDKTVELGPLALAMAKADPKLIKDVSLFDIYEGKSVPEGKMSITFRLTVQPITHTLNEKEILHLYDKAIALTTAIQGVEFRL